MASTSRNCPPRTVTRESVNVTAFAPGSQSVESLENVRSLPFESVNVTDSTTRPGAPKRSGVPSPTETKLPSRKTARAPEAVSQSSTLTVEQSIVNSGSGAVAPVSPALPVVAIPARVPSALAARNVRLVFRSGRSVIARYPGRVVSVFRYRHPIAR
ncbi:hypothetical protein ACFQL4_24085 [Halosimplex aquaticum]